MSSEDASESASGVTFLTGSEQGTAPAVRIERTRVNNLRDLSCRVPLGTVVAVCGVSGSGKTSLAFDTLHAEGQRRYLETFAPGARTALTRLPAPDVDRITHLPPTIALGRTESTGDRRSTLGTLTGVHDLLAEFFARVGRIICPECDTEVRRDYPPDLLAWLTTLPAGTRYQVGFDLTARDGEDADSGAWSRNRIDELTEAGYARVVTGSETARLSDPGVELTPDSIIIVDRLTASDEISDRAADSVETAFRAGGERCVVLVAAPDNELEFGRSAERVTIGGREWSRVVFSVDLTCDGCDREFIDPEPRLFRPVSPLGRCADCEGRGQVAIPLASGTTTTELCPSCHGTRLRPEALAVRVGGRHIVGWLSNSAADIALRLSDWAESASETDRNATASLREDLTSVLDACHVLALRAPFDRPTEALASGERRGAELAGVIARPLVGSLVILDEPSAGLHRSEHARITHAVETLVAGGNSVLLVDHAPEVIRSATHIIEVGPGAGEAGGKIVFEGTREELESSETATGHVFRRETWPTPKSEPRPSSASLTLNGCSRKNLRDISATFPLGQLIAIVGPSGSGKTALLTALGNAIRAALDESDDVISDDQDGTVVGVESLGEVVTVDDTPPGRSGRSNAATFLKFFDPIRSIFATTPDAAAKGFTKAEFSFNSARGGRCLECQGQGRLRVELELLPDLWVDCPECDGTRYRPDVREVTYRSLSIDEVLALTASEAFGFFRGEGAVQRKLQPLKDVGLSYLRLGQPTETLSGGEVRRLKLAQHLASGGRSRKLFLIDEPSAGLHGADANVIADCLGALVDIGHTVVFADHAPELILAADHVLELCPTPERSGGGIRFAGTPAELLADVESLTGKMLSRCND